MVPPSSAVPAAGRWSRSRDEWVSWDDDDGRDEDDFTVGRLDDTGEMRRRRRGPDRGVDNRPPSTDDGPSWRATDTGTWTTTGPTGANDARTRRDDRRRARRARREPRDPYPPDAYPPDRYPPDRYPPDRYPPDRYAAEPYDEDVRPARGREVERYSEVPYKEASYEEVSYEEVPYDDPYADDPAVYPGTQRADRYDGPYDVGGAVVSNYADRQPTGGTYRDPQPTGGGIYGDPEPPRGIYRDPEPTGGIYGDPQPIGGGIYGDPEPTGGGNYGDPEPTGGTYGGGIYGEPDPVSRRRGDEDFDSQSTGAYLPVRRDRGRSRDLATEAWPDDDDGGSGSSFIGSLTSMLTWYAVPVVGYVVYALFLSDGDPQPGCVEQLGVTCVAPRDEAIGNLVGGLPQLGLSFVLSMMLIVILRWFTKAWRSLTIGFVASVVGAGVATLFFTVLNSA